MRFARFLPAVVAVVVWLIVFLIYFGWEPRTANAPLQNAKQRRELKVIRRRARVLGDPKLRRAPNFRARQAVPAALSSASPTKFG
jgi:hypothetical protein